MKPAPLLNCRVIFKLHGMDPLDSTILKQDATGDIVVHGGVSFWRSLIRLDLIDEYRVTVFPCLAGQGRRLFDDLEKPRQLELTASTSFTNGTIELEYRRPR